MRLLIAALVICGLAGVALASTPSQELDKARTLFRAGSFADAIPTLNYLLYPEPRLAEEDDLLEAHVLLGVCAVESGDPATARREFLEVLFLDRSYTLDALIFSEKAIDFFEEVRADLEEKERADAEQRRLAEENQRLQRYLDAMTVIETRPFWVNFIPFGAGQAQNGERGKAIFFATSQAVFGGVSATIFLYLAREYGFPNGQIGPNPTPAEVDRARLLQQIEIGSGAICLGLMAWGIVDAYLNYQPSVRREPDESLLPPELRKKRPPPPSEEARRFHLTPTATADSIGLSLTWEL